MKSKKIIDLHMTIKSFENRSSSFNAICEALYISSKGTKHFYETLNMLADCNEEYKEEFELLKNKS